MVYLRTGQFDNAIADYDSAVEISPKLADALYGRGLAKERKGSLTAGLADMKLAKKTDPTVEEKFRKEIAP